MRFWLGWMDGRTDGRDGCYEVEEWVKVGGCSEVEAWWDNGEWTAALGDDGRRKGKHTSKPSQ
jgi:hypothetical protein